MAIMDFYHYEKKRKTDFEANPFKFFNSLLQLHEAIRLWSTLDTSNSILKYTYEVFNIDWLKQQSTKWSQAEAL